jgi:P-type Ca2+ transporter type 2C
MAIAEATAKRAAPEQPPLYAVSVGDALQAQHVDPNRGLSTEEAAKRRESFGLNKFAEEKKEPRWQAFLRQYRDPMQIVLLVAGIICLFIPHQALTGILLLVLTLLNAFLGLSQEGKAAASVAALQKMMVVKTKVFRDGQLSELPMDQLVPGDVVNIEAGDIVPADGRIIRAATLEIDESALTGESLPVPKQVETVSEDSGLGDRLDMAFMNTNVTRGAGTIVVTGTGMATEVGHISKLLQTTKAEKTPLTVQLDRLTGQILIIAGFALVASISLGLLRGEAFQTLFLAAVAFSVSAIPTALPAVVTTVLTIGTTQLAKEGAIVKRLRSVETLGSTSAINSDKTGTLTLNQMTAVQMSVVGRRYAVSGEGYSTQGTITRVGGQTDVPLDTFLLPMALTADATVRNGELIGDPTEGALVVLAAKGGVDPELTRQEYPRVAEVPFDAAYKLMATFHQMKTIDGRPVIRCYVKGAPDQLLARAATVYNADGAAVPLDGVRDRYLDENRRLGAQGLRVMATAMREIDPASFNPGGDLLGLVNDLTLLALVGIVDPPRPEAKVSIAKATGAGMKVRMITGDHAVTAEAIARELGIRGQVMTGQEFGALSEADAEARIDQIGVIARVTPEHKVKLVEVLRRHGDVVAMTGDGVNDAPALKDADIGVAMGITGTEVAKEAAVMILTDDNFATIVKAVEEGRSLYDNLMRYIRFQIGTLFGFIGVFLGAAIFNILGGIPFLPLQTLWLNFSVGLFQNLGLGLGKPREGLMALRPRPKNEPVLGTRMYIWLIVNGLLMTVGTLAVIGSNSKDANLAHTLGLTTFALFNLFFSLETADEDRSLFSGEILRNPQLLKWSGLSILTIILTPQFGPLQNLLDTKSLTLGQWGVCLLVALSIIVLSEVKKALKIRTVPESKPNTTPPSTQPTLQTT